MALALDGTATALLDGVDPTVAKPALTTTHTNCIVIVCSESNDDQITGISDTAGLTWALRKAVVGDNGFGGARVEEVWWARAASILSSDTITVQYGELVSYAAVTAFGISGALASGSPFDTNGALPASTAYVDGGSATTVALTTSNANDFLFACYRIGVADPTQGAGWTLVSGNDASFHLVEYKIVSATQSGLSAAVGTGAGSQQTGIGDAVKQASASAGDSDWLPYLLNVPFRRRRRRRR